MYPNIRALKNNIAQAIFSALYGKNALKQLAQDEKRKRYNEIKFDTITKHAQKRLEERFAVYGYTIKDIKNDIRHKRKRTKNKDGTIKIRGHIGTYVISEQHVLITVI